MRTTNFKPNFRVVGAGCASLVGRPSPARHHEDCSTFCRSRLFPEDEWKGA
jgi:hypothetical protein